MSNPGTHSNHRGWQAYEVAAVLLVVLLAVWVWGRALEGSRGEAPGTARAKERQDKLTQSREQARQELESFGALDGQRFRIPVSRAMQEAADAMAKDPAAFRSDLLQRLPPAPETPAAPVAPAGNQSN